MPALDDQALVSEVEQILHGETFRSSEVLRRLLRFLAEQTAAGQADQLKEYTIAVDGLGKPSSYDARHDSAVRVEVGRLRQKLAEYYRTEGKGNLFIIDLPKARFRLTCENRPPAAAPLPPPLIFENTKVVKETKFRLPLSLILLGLAVVSVLGIIFAVQLRRAVLAKGTPVVQGTAALEELWRPFLQSNRPVIMAIEDPLFMQLHRGTGIFYRDKAFDQWDDLSASPTAKALREALKNPDISPSRYYTTMGELTSAFLIGKFLGARNQNISLVQQSELSWQQFADNNILFVGNLFDFVYMEQVHGYALPLEPQLVLVAGGIRNTHPRPGEPELFLDQFSTAPSGEGMAYALVTHLPGPLGNSDVESFTSHRSAGYVAAVQWFSDPGFANELVSKLKEVNGKIPRYYQVLLKVKFKDDVPTEITYVLSCELH